MKKILAAAAVLLSMSSSAFAALPPGVFTGQRPPVSGSHRVHVSNSQHMHTPTGNRVRMTPSHGQMGPVGGRMSSMPNSYRPGGSASASVHAGPSHGPRYDRVYVRPSLPPHRYYRPLPPPQPSRWRYAGYYARPYRYSTIWYGYPLSYYGYPCSFYYGSYYAAPGVSISVRLI